MNAGHVLRSSMLVQMAFLIMGAGQIAQAQQDLDIAAMRRMIAEEGLQYSVEDNWITILSPDIRARLGGAPSLEDLNRIGLQPNWPFTIQELARSSYDWRNIDGHSYVSGVRDQGTCGSCWDFAAVAMLESSLMIDRSQPDTDPDFSEQFVLSCLGGRNSCDGGYAQDALDFLHTTGTPTEGCFPYSANDGISCSARCPDYNSLIERIPSWYWVTTSAVNIAAIKGALAQGPVGTWFRIYESFYGYDDGIYDAHGSTYTGYNHYVLIVGYDDAQQCWIAKNSWNASWGEDGYFRIKYDSGCDFGMYSVACPTVSVTVTTSPAGLVYYVDGVSHASASAYRWTLGSSHMLGTYSPQPGFGGAQYLWSNWSDGGGMTHDVSPTGDTTYTANFQSQNYYLTMNAGNGGSASPSSGWLSAGSTVSINAIAPAGYYFARWEGMGSGSYTGRDNPAQVTMNGPITEWACFFPDAGDEAQGTIVAWGAMADDRATDLVAIVAGGFHSLGMNSGGSIVAWGDNRYHQCTVPAPNTSFVAMAAGDYHSIGVKEDGSVVAWGSNGYGQCDVPSPNVGFVDVAGGEGHSLGLKSDGSIVAWGYNYYGQCNVPSPNTGFVDVAAGEYHSLGLRNDGSIVAWGYNNYGQCTVPSPNTGFMAVTAGWAHSMGLKTDGTISSWGLNVSGQCSVPSPNAGFVAVAAGYTFSMGLKSDGRIVGWGWNGDGQCVVPGPDTGFVSLAAGERHGLGLKSDGTFVAWGYNENGQCSVPPPNMDFTAVATCGDHNLGMRAIGTIVAWGDNQHGQCNYPVYETGYTAIAAGENHSLGLRDGAIRAWGSNDYGQCTVPAPNMDFVDVAAGFDHSLGLKSNGSVVAWGWNGCGQCAVPLQNTGFIDIAAGYDYSLGLKSDGTIVAWGWGASIPYPNSGFTEIVGGTNHSLGLKNDGSIVAWGDNEYGQCYVPSPNSGFIAMAAGAYHNLGLKSDGSIVAWGLNDAGQCSVPLPNVGYVAVAAGEQHSLGIRGSLITTAIGQAEGVSRLGPITPNPFNPVSTIAFEVSSACFVRLQVFDLRGRLVRTLVDQPLAEGSHQVQWGGTDDDGRQIASGVYFCRMEAGSFRETRRMTLVK